MNHYSAASAAAFILLCATPALAHEFAPAFVEKITGAKNLPAQEIAEVPDPRGSERTIISFPEWYIVYSAQEYADFVTQGGQPSKFPFFLAIRQYWDSVELSKKALHGRTIDDNTNTVLQVIGISFTVEYTLIGAYEKSIGRVFEFTTSGKTAEDRATDTIAKQYGDFLEHTPWYLFPYNSAITQLWSTWGWRSLSARGLERRIVFSVGYQLKGAYGALIKKATRAQLGVAVLETKFRVAEIEKNALIAVAGVEVKAENADGSLDAVGPRYRAFKSVAEEIARQGGRFVSIENNESIMLTLLAAEDNFCVAKHENLAFVMPLITRPMSRIAIVTPVTNLTTLLREFEACDVAIEHIYDY